MTASTSPSPPSRRQACSIRASRSPTGWLKIFTAVYILVGIGILVEVVRRIGMGFVLAREELKAAKASGAERGRP